MTNAECIAKGNELLGRADREGKADAAFRASYYFFWGQDFESAKKALQAAYSLKKEEYLPRDYAGMAGIMDLRVHSAIVHSFEGGLEEIIRKDGVRTAKCEGALRRMALWDDTLRGLAMDYLDFDTVVFLRAYALSAKL